MSATSPLDSKPWVTVEAPKNIMGVSVQRVTNERSATRKPGAVFFPKYGYAQWESDYPPEVTR